MWTKVLVTVILFMIGDLGHHKWMLLRFKTIVYHICSRKNSSTKMQLRILDSKCTKMYSISLIKALTTIMNASTRFWHP